MKTCSAYGMALLALALLSCTKTVPQFVRHEISAYAGAGDAVKTVLDPSDDALVLWSPAEHVNVFVGDVSYEFIGTNTSAAASVTFAGSTPGELGTYVMLSPYSGKAVKAGDVVGTSLSPAQGGREGSFQDGTLVLAGTSSAHTVTCMHVCSGIRFSVEGDDISRVSLLGLAGEKIAGDFTFRFIEGVPVSSEGTLEEVVLTPSDGAYFTPGAWYYIILLPTVFPQGICLAAQSDSRGMGILMLNESLTFSRAKFKSKARLDDAMAWSQDPSRPDNTCYGPSNSFCLRPGGSLSVDVSPLYILPGWLRSGVVFDGAPLADGYDILWNTGDVSASLDGTTLKLYAGASEGVALVAIKKGDTILWSFLVWVTAAAPAESTLPTGAKILPPLGGNLYFQWGRKDPLQSDCTAVENRSEEGLPYSIAHPTEYIRGGAAVPDWFCADASSQDSSLWGQGGMKTVWDPCPEGYRVPTEADFTHAAFDYAYLEDNFSALGYRYDTGFYASSRTYWTGTASTGYSTALDDGIYPDIFYGQTRNIASPVRCVKQ